MLVLAEPMNIPWNQTKRAVVDLIRRHGPVSRIQLANQLRLTKAAMTQVVQDLLDEGVLIGGEYVATPGRGRPQQQLQLGQGGVYGIGLTISVDYLVELVLVDVANRVVAHRQLPNRGASRYQSPAQYARCLAREIDKLAAKATNGWVAGVGVSVSGGLAADGQWMVRSNDFPTVAEANEFLKELRQLVALPLDLCSCVSAALLAERWLDAALPENPSVLYVNDHLGVGLILEGKMQIGSAAHPHWLGHLQIDPKGKKCYCGRRGCLAATASLFAITDELAGYTLGKRPPIPPGQSQKELLSLGRRYDRGDVKVRRVAQRAFEDLGLAIRSLASLFSLDLIVLGAWSGITPDRELERIRKLLAEGHYGDRVSPRPTPQIRWASQGKYQEPFGAAILQIDRALEKPVG